MVRDVVMDRVAGDRPGRRILLRGNAPSGGEGGVEGELAGGASNILLLRIFHYFTNATQ